MKRWPTVGWMVVIALALFVGARSAEATDLAADARFHHKFKLLPGSAEDRYVLCYPIEVTRPGKIRVYIEPTGATQGSGEFASVWLVDARMFNVDLPTWREWIVKINQYNPLEWVAGDEIRGWVKDVKKFFGDDDKPKWYHGGQRLSKSVPLEHAVDDPELAKTGGRYVVILRNPSTREYHGELLIAYPGERWDVAPELEASYERKPDLAVENLALDDQNRVVVTVANKGPGWLPQVRWNQKGAEAIQLLLEVDGKSWGGATLAVIDPRKTLVLADTRLAYTTELVLREPARVTAVIDSNQVVAEADERNNRRSETLSPPSGGGKRVKREPEGALTPSGQSLQPAAADLVVSDIFLDSRKRIAVRVSNQGAGLPAEAWQQNPPVQLKLWMNGRGWAVVPLAFFDPGRALSQPGGSAVYTSDHVVRQALEIRAVIDEENRLPETNENNNALTRSLAP